MGFTFPPRWIGAALVSAALFGAAAVCAADSVGTPYHARDPVACPAKSAQPKGAPSEAQAILLFRCALEGVGGYDDKLTLIDNVKLEIGGSRPSQSGDGYSGIDVAKPVYPIRGRWTKYRCTNVKTYPGVGANNCNVWDETDGSGICYRTTFGDWRCMMFSRANTMRTGLVPPPH